MTRGGCRSRGGKTQSSDLEGGVQCRQRRRTGGPEVVVRAGRRGGRPDAVLEGLDPVALRERPDFLRVYPRREIMRRTVELDPGPDIILQLALKIAGQRAFEQRKAVKGRVDRVRLLDDQLPAIVPPLEGARNREGEEQPDQAEHRALGGRKPGDIALVLQVAQTQAPTKIQHYQRAEKETRGDDEGEECE